MVDFVDWARCLTLHQKQVPGGLLPTGVSIEHPFLLGGGSIFIDFGYLPDATAMASQLSNMTSASIGCPSRTEKKSARRDGDSLSYSARFTLPVQDSALRRRKLSGEPSPATVTATAAYGVFNAGQAAMMIISSGDAITNVQQANPSPNIGFFPLPGASVKSTGVLVNPLVNLTVNAASPVKQQALAFLDFIGRSWQSVNFANDENSISSLDAAKAAVPQKLSLFGPFIKAHRLVISPLNWANNPTGVAVFRADVTALLAGTKTIDQVLTETDAAW